MNKMNDLLFKYAQLSSVFDYFSLGVMVLSDDRSILTFNLTAEMITGLKASDLIGRKCVEGLSDSLSCGDCAYHRALSKKSDSTGSSFEVVDSTGQSRRITRIVSPILGPDQSSLGCIEVFQDHSVFTDLLERVRHDDRRLKLILDSLDTGVLTVDRGGHITFFNTRAEGITGFDRGNVLGKSWDMIFGSKTSPEAEHFSQTIADGKSRLSTAGEIRTRQGQPLPVRANYMALKNEDGQIVGGLATFSDLSLVYQFNSAILDRYTMYDMVGKDPAIQKIFDIVPVVAASDATVLIEGPTGTGKDVLAKVLHNASKRSDNPMVKVNCAALPADLLESEMFGYVKGAFTGADKDKPGRFQEADTGTIFLDEIGDMPLALQAKLLRVLEDKEFYPLGSRKTTRVDVRIISATNQNLERLVSENRFREDLFYRLNVMRLELPSLKDRRSDIPLLIHHILKRLRNTRDTRVEDFSEEAMEVLLNHHYPGNVRELENIIEHALIVCQESLIEPRHLPLALQSGKADLHPQEPQLSFVEKKEIGEKAMILNALEQNNWNRNKTAQALSVDRTTLWRKMKKYGLAG